MRSAATTWPPRARLMTQPPCLIFFRFSAVQDAAGLRRQRQQAHERVARCQHRVQIGEAFDAGKRLRPAAAAGDVEAERRGACARHRCRARPGRAGRRCGRRRGTAVALPYARRLLLAVAVVVAVPVEHVREHGLGHRRDHARIDQPRERHAARQGRGRRAGFSTPIHSDWMSFSVLQRLEASLGRRGDERDVDRLVGRIDEAVVRQRAREQRQPATARARFSMAKRMFTQARDGSIRAEDERLLFLLLYPDFALPRCAAQDWPKRRPIHIVVGFAPGEHHRPGGAPGGAQARRGARPVGGGREQARRQRQRRRAAGEARRARRLHAVRHQRRLRGQPEPVRNAGYDPVHRFHAGDPRPEHAEHHHGQPGGAGEEPAGADRARAQGAAVLRLVGHRHHHAPLDGAHQDGGRESTSRTCPTSRRRRSARRSPATRRSRAPRCRRR